MDVVVVFLESSFCVRLDLSEVVFIAKPCAFNRNECIVGRGDSGRRSFLCLGVLGTSFSVFLMIVHSLFLLILIHLNRRFSVLLLKGSKFVFLDWLTLKTTHGLHVAVYLMCLRSFILLMSRLSFTLTVLHSLFPKPFCGKIILRISANSVSFK